MSYLQLNGTGGYGRIGRPQAVGIDAGAQGVTIPWWLVVIGGGLLVFGGGWLTGKRTGRRGSPRNRLMRSAERLISSRERQLPKVFVIKAEGRPKPYRHRTLKAYNRRVEMLKKWQIPFTVEVIEELPEPGEGKK